MYSIESIIFALLGFSILFIFCLSIIWALFHSSRFFGQVLLNDIVVMWPFRRQKESTKRINLKSLVKDMGVGFIKIVECLMYCSEIN